MAMTSLRILIATVKPIAQLASNTKGSSGSTFSSVKMAVNREGLHSGDVGRNCKEGKRNRGERRVRSDVMARVLL